MKPEPKSIFTSEKILTSQLDQERSEAPEVCPPTSTSASTSALSLPAPIPGDETLSRERGQKKVSWVDASSSTRRISEAAIVVDRSRQSSHFQTSSDIGARNNRASANAFPRGQRIEPIIEFPLEKPDLPAHHTESEAPGTAHASTSKHPRADDSGGSRPISTERPPKRTRPKLTGQHIPDLQTFVADSKKSPASPPSSHTYRQKPMLPASLSSSEAVAAMLNKTRVEPAGVTTLKLARGSITSGSLSRASSTPGSWTTSPRSPDPTNKSSSGLQLLGSVGIIEFLEQDERLTFMIDVANSANFLPGGPLQITFANASLRASNPILEMVAGKVDLASPGVVVTNNFPEFKAWVLSFVKDGESLDILLPSFVFGGLTWTCSTLRKRLRLISASDNIIAGGATSGSSNGSASLCVERVPTPYKSTPSPLASVMEPPDYFGDATATHPPSISTSPLQLSSNPNADDVNPNQNKVVVQSEGLTTEMMQTQFPEASSFDWTRLPLSAALPRHIQFARSIDWAATPLGPIENWSFDLRAMCNLIMGSPHPAAMYWGPEYIAIYNEAYIMLAGQKHPYMMGQSYKTAWAEIWPEVESVFSNAWDSGHATMKDDDCLFIRRNGFLEESYFSWSIIPLVGEDGSVVGLYNPCFEKTRRKIAERRMLTLREIGEKTAAAREVKGFWGQVIKGLEYNHYDVPFAFLYSVSDDSDSDMSSMHSGSLAQAPQCVLEGTLGVPQDHKAATSPLDLKTSDEGFAPYLRESMKTDSPVLLKTEDDGLSSTLIEGLQWRGFGDPCRSVVICPIHPTTASTGEGVAILGFLVMGINPRRPYDDDYSLFIQLLSRQLATSMASVVLFEEEIKRGEQAARLAALDRQELSKQLDLRTQEAVESETKFTRMAEFAPVGMFIADSSGQITYSNDAWWEISRHPRTDDSANTWMDSIKDEDRDSVENVWDTLINNKKAVTHEFRFKTPWQDRNGSRSDTWVLMSAYPEKDLDGHLKSVFGSITNISQQKWAEDFQKRRMEEAFELKRQQENFIDMTSHEMRNPLSAILQCSDEITTSLMELESGDEEAKKGDKLIDVLESSIDAAQTIALCAQHQKRIVDDILTLSKLDSALLMVTPVAVQPIAVVQRALKMFEGELDTNDIAIEFKLDQSYFDLSIDWVKLDPSRLLQVLINLTTNAIKFTHGQEKRTIIVRVGASKERSSHNSDYEVSYFPSRSNRKDLDMNDKEWGTGEEVYLHFAVQDTGRGLDPNEKNILFQRFSQASPRTHVQYGGSGLGLFISRELTELQGGEIGVSSQKGVGSTFAFYIKAKKVDYVMEEPPISTAVPSLRRHSSQSVALERKHAAEKIIQSSSTSVSSPRRASTIALKSSPVQKPPTSSLDHSMLRILIVEDNLVNQRVLQKQLKNLGFMTELANHGGEALDILKTSTYWAGREKDGLDVSIVLMDLEMPVMDGLTCARSIRDFEDDGTFVKHVPIIAVTANARMKHIETALSAGMDDVISKPFRMLELIPKIDELVSRHNLTTTPLAAPSRTSEAGSSASS